MSQISVHDGAGQKRQHWYQKWTNILEIYRVIFTLYAEPLFMSILVTPQVLLQINNGFPRDK